MSKVVLNDVASGYNLSAINSNFQKIEDTLNNEVLFRDNPVGEPNAMQDDLDMNGHRIYNLPKPISLSEPARYQDLLDSQSGQFGIESFVRIPVTESVPTLPDAATRANKQLSFDASGNPVVTVPSTGSAALLQTDLADGTAPTKGAGMIGYQYSNTYPALTIGEKVNDLVDSIPDLFVLPTLPKGLRATILTGTSTDDHTAYLQAAINLASQGTHRGVRPGRGKWNFTKLYLCYDAVNNPGFNAQRNGEVSLIGEGWTNENEALGVAPTGTVLNHTSVSGSGIIVSTAALDISPWVSRDSLVRDFSLITGTSGFGIECKGVPGARFIGVEIIQTNNVGSYFDITTAYFGSMEKCRTRKSVYGTTTTGYGVRFGNTAPGAGLFTMRDSAILDCTHPFYVASGNWTVMSFYDSELKADTGGSAFECASGANIDQLNMFGPYFEGNAVSWIKDNAANNIKNVYIAGIWGLDNSGLSGPAIDLTAPDSVRIDGGFIREMRKTFCNIANVTDINASGNFSVNNITFKYYSALPGPVTLFTGIVPELGGIDINGGGQGSNVSIHSSLKNPIRRKAFYSTNSAMLESGHIRQTNIVVQAPASSGTTYTHAAQGYPAISILSTSAGTTTYELKKGTTAKLGDAFTLEVKNRGTGTVNVTNEIGGTLIVALGPNTSARLMWSTIFDAWIL